MKSFRRRCSPDAPRPALETLEERALLSATSGALHPLALLPSEVALTSPKFTDQWYLQNTGQTLSSNPSGPATGTPGADIGAVNAWNLTTGSKNVVVAVFDTGIDLSHPDLVNNIWHNGGEVAGNGVDDDHNGFIDDTTGWNFVDGDNNVQDTSFTGHGTLVSGVIAAQGNNAQGVAGTNWHVSLLPIKVGTDLGVSSSALQAGIAYVEALKAKGVNIVAINASYISFGIPSFSDIGAISTTANYGILYVSAAGNSSINFDSLIPGGFLPSSMMLVAATDNQDHLASFSNYGSKSVALGAPGVDILTTIRGGGYGMFSGTSFAGPMVSGTAALLKAFLPGASLDQIKNAILAGSTSDPFLAGKTITGKRLSAYGALQTLVGNQRPIGHVDALSRAGVSGWAYDYNGGVRPVAVALLADGKFLAATTAATDRADLGAAFGSPGHAFSFAGSTFDSLGPGSHTIQVYAIDIPGFGPTLAPTLLRTAVLQSQAPIGSLDIFSSARAIGWSLDLDTPGSPVTVRLFLDGNDAGGGSAAAFRQDLQNQFGTGSHGFDFAIPTLSPGLHRLDMYAEDTTSHALTYIASREINTAHYARGSFDSFNGSVIKGWAQDLDAPTNSIQIRYQIDANAPVLATAGEDRNDLQTPLGSKNHAFNITLPQLPAGTHSVTVWAIDPANHYPTLLGKRVSTVANPGGVQLPFGAVEIATTTRVKGWAFDPSTPTSSLQVRIDVDGVAGTPFTASVQRNELLPALHFANLGFDKALTLSGGPHRLDIYAIDAPGGTPVLLASRIVGGSSLAAGILAVTPTTITGAASLVSTPATHPEILLEIDGAVLATTPDNTTRFTFTLPRLAPGVYTYHLYALDPTTLAPTLFATNTLRLTTLN
jgi:subtilisin family serine protease